MKEKYTPEIIADNPEQHKEDMEKQLELLQVLFCDRLYQQYKNECKRNGKPVDKTFSDIMEEQMVYYAGDLRMLVIMRSEKSLSEAEQHALIAEKYYKILDGLYDKLPEGKIDDNSPEYIKSRASELNILIDYLETEKRKVKDELPDKWREMHERPKNEDGQIENRAGIIDFNSLKEYFNPDIRQLETALGKEGFSEFDDFLQIHLPTPFGSEKKFGPKAVRESLACLAEKIIDKHPETRAIVAVSWLLDHPVFQRFIKMKIIGEGSSNWRQLIGSNGQIEQARVKKFFETGKMPYRNLIGYVPIEEFLREYLPKDRRGRVKLKRIKKDFDPEKFRVENTFRDDGKKLAAAWDSGELDSKEKVVDYMESLHMLTFVGVLKHLGYYEKFVEMMTANIGRSREDINSENREFIIQIEEGQKKYFKEINQAKYIEEEITID
ncbi:MAG: hypothetical protein PHS62_04730 [Patescibacteria group bacterium]|nr:hypothetical protein [Patescibacteria group bacterium]